MKNKGVLALMLGALVISFSTTSYSIPGRIDFAPVKVTKPASKHGLRLPNSTPKGTAGPMCPPISGCVSM